MFSNMKRELSTLYEEIVALEYRDVLEILKFKFAHQVRKLLNQSTYSQCPTNEKGSKLPKLEVPTFDCDVLHWVMFWEQFSVSIPRTVRSLKCGVFAVGHKLWSCS